MLTLGALALTGCGEAAPGQPRQAVARVRSPAGATAVAPVPAGGAAGATGNPATTTGAGGAPAGAGVPPAGAAAPAGGAGSAGGGAAAQADQGPHSIVARMDASSDRIIAEGKVHIAAGAPSDAEIRREIEAVKKAGIVLPAGESVSSFENAGRQARGPGAEAETPVTPWNPSSKPIADWIVPVLEWASQHGWTGVVTSGYRTYFEQAQLNAAGAFSAPAGLSNHETTRYPGGAVDVTNPGQLIVVLRGYPGPLKLVGGVLGPADPEHFSATGY